MIVIASVPYWRQVRLADGRQGWGAKTFLEFTGAAIPVTPPVTIPSDAWLEVHFVDVGQGDGIWIHTYDDGIPDNGVFEGRNIVIDGGPDAGDNRNQMLAYLENQAHHNAVIDALIVTHPHNDHYPGADGIRRHFDVVKYYDPGYPKSGTAYPAFLAAMRSESTTTGQPIQAMVGGNTFDSLDYWGSELSAEILYSYPGESNAHDLGDGNTLENNASIVLRLEYGNHSFLFMGDAEGKERSDSPDTAHFVEKILLDTLPPETLKATVLKVAHHGSETSSTVPFIMTVNPDIVVVMSGRKSFSGTFIPDATTLQHYCDHNPNVRIYRTDQNDEHIVIRTNGSALEVSSLEGGEPFTGSTC